MNIKKRLVMFAGAGALVVAVAGIASAGSPANTPNPQAAVDAVRAGKGTPLPTHAADVHMVTWDGCHFVFKTSHSHNVQAPGGQVVNMVDPPDVDDPAAAARPSGCVDREPTQAEIDAAQARLNGLSTAAAVAGAPPLPPPPRATAKG